MRAEEKIFNTIVKNNNCYLYQSEWPKRVFWTGNEWDQTMSSGIFEVAKYVEIGWEACTYIWF